MNVSALLAAVEFGIQPLLYHDASGAPLYCPYPLSVAIPAMMLGHLTIAGVAEAFVSAGVVAFLQRSDLSLLKSTSGAAIKSSRDRPRACALRPLMGRTGGTAGADASRDIGGGFRLGRMDGVRLFEPRGAQ